MTTAACVAQFVTLAEQDLAQPANGDLSDADLAAVMTAAVRLYASRCATHFRRRCWPRR